MIEDYSNYFNLWTDSCGNFLDCKSCLGVLWTAILLSVPHCSSCISLIPGKQKRTVKFITVHQIFFSDVIGLNTSCAEDKIKNGVRVFIVQN